MEKSSKEEDIEDKNIHEPSVDTSTTTSINATSSENVKKKSRNLLVVAVRTINEKKVLKPNVQLTSASDLTVSPAQESSMEPEPPRVEKEKEPSDRRPTELATERESVTVTADIGLQSPSTVNLAEDPHQSQTEPFEQEPMPQESVQAMASTLRRMERQPVTRETPEAVAVVAESSVRPEQLINQGVEDVVLEVQSSLLSQESVIQQSLQAVAAEQMAAQPVTQEIQPSVTQETLQTVPVESSIPSEQSVAENLTPVVQSAPQSQEPVTEESLQDVTVQQTAPQPVTQPLQQSIAPAVAPLPQPNVQITAPAVAVLAEVRPTDNFTQLVQQVVTPNAPPDALQPAEQPSIEDVNPEDDGDEDDDDEGRPKDRSTWAWEYFKWPKKGDSNQWDRTKCECQICHHRVRFWHTGNLMSHLRRIHKIYPPTRALLIL